MYDAIIVGARVAGASAAIRLARQGRRVLLLDKVTFPRDTLSTHFLWPRGASYLKRLGLLERVLPRAASGETVRLEVEGIFLSGSVPESLLRRRLEAVHGDGGGVTTRFLSARRVHLDAILVEAAREAGAEVREGVAVTELLGEGDRVVGIRAVTDAGTSFTERAAVVVGADGRLSTVAALLKLPRTEVRHACTFASYAYFSGVPAEAVTIARRGRLGLGLSPTSDGLVMALAFGPRDWFPAYQRSREENFFRAFGLVSPELEALLRAGRRETPFYGTNDQAAYLRPSAGPGWYLAGDAACFKDQCTASGMTHALRDAELIAEHLRLEKEPREYAEARFLDTWKYYEFVGQQAEMNPPRPDELEIYRALTGSPEQRDRLVAVYGDTYPVREFFSRQNLKEILRGRLGERPDYRDYERTVSRSFRNPFAPGAVAPESGLTRTCADFALPVGPGLLRRVEGYFDWQRARSRAGTWQYSRTLKAFPGPRSRLRDEAGREVAGINFASQDYLALGSHPRVREAALKALRDFGPHSAGSPMVIGNTELSEALEAELGALVGAEHVVLFPTGWAAGYGAITGLVRAEDHVVMDRLSHSSLQQGAMAATRNIHKHPHLDAGAARALLREIRSRDRRNGILVVTEGIFSMDSDAPDLGALQEACREYDATLFVDVAHDLGASGPGGTGQIGLQGLLGKVDLVMGSFSKTFASNGGFLATRSAAVGQYVKMFGNPHIFSNALSPVQSAVALETVRIVRSAEGDRLREELVDVVGHFRRELAAHGATVLGQPSSIVPVLIGEERRARLAHRLMQERQIAAMILEYPVVAVGASRFRLQVMASHTREEASAAAVAIGEVLREAQKDPSALSRAPRMSPSSSTARSALMMAPMERESFVS